MITRLILTLAVGLFFTRALPVIAAEHPSEHPEKSSEKTEHPKKKGKEDEHPTEHPEKEGAEKEVTTADISAGIRRHIESEAAKADDGKFHVEHEGKDLALELVKVHDDRLSNLGQGKYFACVDMKAADGTNYDIDFFLSGKAGEMTVTETSVHKIDGKPLYNWKEEGGVWKKEPASS